MSHRTQVVLTDEQYTLLRLRSTETGLPLGELVRRAVAATYGPSSSERLTALDRSFGAWGDRDFDGESYVEEIRPGLAVRAAKLSA